MNEQTILLAEDSEDAVILLKLACKKSRLRNPMHVVADGEEAIQYLSGEGEFKHRNRFPLPSLLLLDLKMPKVDGFEVLSWLRARPGINRLPVVVLTSSSDPGDIARAYELGASSYLVKPIGFDDLVELLNRLEGWWMGVNQAPELND